MRHYRMVQIRSSWFVRHTVAGTRFLPSVRMVWDVISCSPPSIRVVQVTGTCLPPPIHVASVIDRCLIAMLWLGLRVLFVGCPSCRITNIWGLLFNPNFRGSDSRRHGVCTREPFGEPASFSVFFMEKWCRFAKWPVQRPEQPWETFYLKKWYPYRTITPLLFHRCSMIQRYNVPRLQFIRGESIVRETMGNIVAEKVVPLP